MTENSIKDKIVRKLGGTGAVAKICGITAGAVSQWGDLIPSKHVGKLVDAGADPTEFYKLPSHKNVVRP